MESIASLLRQTRENKRLTLKDVEAATRIPASYLNVLEGGEGLLSDQVYLLPFLRTYAKFLGMDTNAVVSQFVAELQRTDSRMPPPNRRVATTASPSAPSRLSFWALPLLLLLGILLVGSFLWQNGFSGVEMLWPTAITQNDALTEREKAVLTAPTSEDSFATDLPTTKPTAPSDTTAPIAVAPPSTDFPASPTEDTQPVAVAPPPTQSSTGAATAVQGAPTGSSTGHQLNIQASAPTWVRIVVDDQAPKEMILKTGESREWTAQNGFTLSFGNAGGVTISLDGQTLPPVGKSGQVVRNIRLPADPSTPATATTLQ